MICPKCGSEIPDGSTECFICGETLSAKRPQQMQGNYYQDPMMQNPGQFPQQDAFPKSANGPSKGLIIGLIAFLCIAAVIVIIGSGLFTNKDGVYSSDQLKEAVLRMAEEEGGISRAEYESRLDVDCSFIIDGGNCTMTMTAKVDGIVASEKSYVGTIRFFGNNATIRFTGQGELKGKYNPSAKSLTFDLNRMT